jgi:hypothetical protein
MNIHLALRAVEINDAILTLLLVAEDDIIDAGSTCWGSDAYILCLIEPSKPTAGSLSILRLNKWSAFRGPSKRYWVDNNTRVDRGFSSGPITDFNIEKFKYSWHQI